MTPKEKDRIRPSWSEKCENCGETPIVPMTQMCGPCSFGDADTISGGWWNDETDEPI